MGCGDSPRLPKGVKARKVGDGAEAGATIGPLIDRAAIAKVERTSLQPQPVPRDGVGRRAHRREMERSAPGGWRRSVHRRSRGRVARDVLGLH